MTTFLFESDAKRHLMHFDDSYTAQFARLVTSGIPGDLGRELQSQIKVEVLTGVDGPSSEPDFGIKNGKARAGYSLGEARIGANLTYRQGQLDVFSLNLPEPEKAEVISIPYNTEGDTAITEAYASEGYRPKEIGNYPGLSYSRVGLQRQDLTPKIT